MKPEISFPSGNETTTTMTTMTIMKMPMTRITAPIRRESDDLMETISNADDDDVDAAVVVDVDAAAVAIAVNVVNVVFETPVSVNVRHLCHSSRPLQRRRQQRRCRQPNAAERDKDSKC